MPGFDARFIDELKSKNDLVDVVSKYVRLEQRGGNHWGRCPFHHEKTASFAVNAAEQFFHCFGCHASGDVITFIMNIEALDFYDAVRFLAERAGMTMPEVNYDDEKVQAQKKQKERLLSLMRDTALFYLSNLRSGRATAHDNYILRRKIDRATVNKFGLGASLDFDGLPTYLLDKGYTHEEMVLAGVVGKKDSRYYDALGGRLIVPIINAFDQVVAFGGRLLEKKDFAKYKNTSETPIFSKSNNLYNLNNLKKLKNAGGLTSVIIVEGYMDTISLVQAGFENVVASMGTSLTKDQARILKRYTDKVYISYDGDFAGQKAAIRGLEILKDEGLEVKVVAMPDGMDPDDVITNLGADGYRKCLDEAKPLIDFKLDIIKRTFDVNTIDGKRKYITAAIKVIRESNSPAEQEDLLKTVSSFTKTTYESLRRELLAVEREPEKFSQPTPRIAEGVGDKLLKASRFVLHAYLFNKPYADLTDVDDVQFEDVYHKAIMQYLKEKKGEGNNPRFTDLYDILTGSAHPELSLIAELETDESKGFDQAAYYNDCVRTLKIDKIERRLARVSELFKAETDTGRRREYAMEMNKLLVEKAKYIK